MCGFAGFFMSEASLLRGPGQLAAMLEQLKARGPDAQHVVAWNGDHQRIDGDPVPVSAAKQAMLHARLAIIDPTPGADQPMGNDDGKVWLCYNGEVYGWEADAKQLAEAGVHFRTRSDTEFILRAYEAWGLEKTLSRLRGMYAFALYDARLGKVFLARDPMGKKPLLYRTAVSGPDAGLVFASTLRALLPALTGEWRFSHAALDAYLVHRTIPAPLTLVDNVKRLPNGHWAEYDLRHGSFVLHQQPAIVPCAGDWLSTLDQAVALRTIADRPIGLFLSGGIDSAVIAARLAAHQNPLRAFTAGFPGSAMDESKAAAAVAARFGFEHRIVPVPQSIRDDFSAIVASLDEPFADPSSIPLWYLAREATKEVKVVLSGDGGDELFAGYKRYRQHLRSAWRRNFRWPLAQWKPALAPKGFDKFRQELAMDWREAYSLRFSGFNPAQRCFLQPKLTSMPSTYWRMSAGGHSPLESLLAIDMDNYLPEYILRKSDLTTMAHGLELRSPLLDTVLYANVCSLPADERFTIPPKKILARALPGDLAAELFGGKKKGFNPPLRPWLQQDLRDRSLGLGERLEQLSGSGFCAKAVDQYAAAFYQGNGSLAEGLLQLLVLDESLSQLSAFPGWQS
ncbi:MAG TPA: asparagine synthase (glutamine-hydrolyzing) [Rhodocyclaceae bacterium]|jgi:asparagine synthase (glutamine-hydrolysing)